MMSQLNKKYVFHIPLFKYRDNNLQLIEIDNLLGLRISPLRDLSTMLVIDAVIIPQGIESMSINGR